MWKNRDGGWIFLISSDFYQILYAELSGVGDHESEVRFAIQINQEFDTKFKVQDGESQDGEPSQFDN